ncbi:MAG: ribonuclease H-like domain-containing protein [Herbinix sp.]|nr:ribonuclease H-like domain-containing protein [Herbinix sp.]
MIIRQFSLEQTSYCPLEREYDLNKIAFFDIETTGFAAEATYLYLIGCAYYKDSSFQLMQWFSEDIKEEAILIEAFFEFLKEYDVLLHYNGSGFDIPYLQRKCSLLNLDYFFDQYISIDIYKKILPYKKIFKLENLKQKTLETFLNIHRKDTFNGGDLIQVYQSYLGKKHYERLKLMRTPEAALSVPSESQLLLNQLLLHNEDDIRGLLYISRVLNYADLFEKPIQILQAGVDQDTLSIHFKITASLPVPISFRNDLAHVSVFDNTATLSVHIFEGELKYFYDNYKDYYYLPAEDYAIHKSLAYYVDKDFRIKAKPSSCYIKKQGIFAPQYEMAITPCFKHRYQDKLSFLEIHTDFLLQEENLEQYVKNLLSHIVSK